MNTPGRGIDGEGRARTAAHWAVLVTTSALLALLLQRLAVPAAWLLASMVCAICLALRPGAPRLPPVWMIGAQALVGLLVAGSLKPAVLAQWLGHALLFFTAVLSVVAVSLALGVMLTRRRALPGSSALWGIFPGGASTMTLMAEEHGADVRLVAVMQYLRVGVVVALASAVTHLEVIRK